jgi:hypothetical protein
LGTRYSLALPGQVRNVEGQTDFSPVQGLEGIYLANVYDKDQIKRVKSGLDGISTISTERASGKKSSNTHGTPSLQEQDAFKRLEGYKKTMITFNKGAMWSPLVPPLRDSMDKKIICSDEDDCQLHLNSITSLNYGPFYSTASSLGIVIGTGNVGKYLSTRPDEINTYLSRDGGLTWFEIKKGSHIYEISDHGSIIVLAPDQKATDVVYYSWNEGLTWEEMKISEDLIEISNIITEPTNTGEKFIIYGRLSGSNLKGVVIGLDFSPVHQRWCAFPNKPDTPESDYELWTPNGKISPQCLMGRTTTYVRRKREAQCFNKEEFDKWYFFEICQCTEADWECDVGYTRSSTGSCLPDRGLDLTVKVPEKCDDFYAITQGYRKVTGSMCDGGINRAPLKLPCPGGALLSKSNQVILISLFTLIVGVIIATTCNCMGKVTEYKTKAFDIFNSMKKSSSSSPNKLKTTKKEEFSEFFDEENTLIEAGSPMEKTLRSARLADRNMF